jgi:hypothetical protein
MSDNKQQRSETAQALYKRMETERAPYIRRAEECAKYTIPSLFPKQSDNSSTDFETPYQSVGSRGVNNIGSKLMLALLPPNSPFFRLNPGQGAKENLETMQDVKEKVEQALMLLEQKITRYIETHQIRVTVAEALKVLVVTGNALLFLPPKEGGMKLYKLNSYVLQRDALGNVIQLVTMDKIAYAALPDDVKSIVTKSGQEKKPEDIVEIYTHVYLEDGQFIAYQEVAGEVIPGSEQKFPKEKTPWIPIRMVKVDGESYGRGFVEEYLGDLRSLEGLSKAIVELAAIAANVVFLVNPNGVTRVQKVAKAKPGEFVSGRPDDIHALQLEKYADLQVAEKTASGIEARLSYAFMLNSAVQRNGERVTAEEIRYVAGELEDTLGGIYSILSQELQLPLVRRLLAQLQSMGEIPDLPDGIVEPAITTGLEALGRGHDLNKLATFLDFTTKIPEAAQRLKLDTLLTMIATGLNIDTTNLVKSDEELQQEAMQMQQMELLKQATPNLAKGFADAQMQENQGGK